MRTKAHGLGFVLALVADESLEEFFGEDVALEQEVVIGGQAVERFVERAGHGGHVLHLFRRQIVNVLVERFAGIDLVQDAVEAGHQVRGERQVRVTARVGRAELDALGLRARRIHRNAARGGTVAAGVGEVDRRFVARHQALVAVGGGSDDRRQRPGVLQQTADVPQRQLAEARVAVAGEQRVAVLPQRLVGVHAAAVVGKQRLGHEGSGFAVLIRHIAHDVLEQHHVVGRLHQRVELLVDFGLAAGGDFVVMALDDDADLLHDLDHFGSQILIVVGRRQREVAFLVTRAVAQVVFGAARIPAAFLGVDVVIAGVLRGIEMDVVEDEKLGFGAEVGGVGDAAVLEIRFGLAGDEARVAIVALARDRIDDVADHAQRRDLEERIDVGRLGVGHQQHVAFVDRSPAANRRAVEAEAFLEGVLVQLGDGIRNVLGEARQIGETQVDLLGSLFLGVSEYLFRGHDVTPSVCGFPPQ